VQRGNEKQVYHIVFSTEGTEFSYEVGDSLGVFPSHDPELVERMVASLGVSGREIVTVRQKVLSLRDALTHALSLRLSRQKFVDVLQERSGSLPAPELGTDSSGDVVLHGEEICDLLRFMRESGGSGKSRSLCDPQRFVDLLPPLLPRLYSIASHRETVAGEIHLTVHALCYSEGGRWRRGVCSHYLCHVAPLAVPRIPIYLQPHRGFTLPEDGAASVIMIGPGTGVAPFRAFMQKRIHRGDTGRSWLFFGERHEESLFLYEKEWTSLQREGKLQLTTAFSRDQPEKIYVQHRLEEAGDEVYRWLEEGAYLFVCGEAKSMAKEVEETLVDIIARHGRRAPASAEEYLASLRREGRYHKDVY